MKDKGNSEKDCPAEARRKERISSAGTPNGAKRILSPINIFVKKIEPGK
jgi:hypothetical protein